jgi:hypothetical protein
MRDDRVRRARRVVRHEGHPLVERSKRLDRRRGVRDRLVAAIEDPVEVQEEGVVTVGDHRSPAAVRPTRAPADTLQAVAARVTVAAALLYRSDATRCPLPRLAV